MPVLQDPHAALLDFASRILRTYSGAYSDLSDPVNKNRLAVVSVLLDGLAGALGLGEDGTGFGEHRNRLLQMIADRETAFDPPFDSEYGSGKGVFEAFQNEITGLHDVEDCWPIRYVVAVHDRLGGEHIEDFRLKAVKQASLKRLFAPNRRAKILTGSFPVAPEHQLYFNSFIPVEKSLGVKLSSALKTVKWDFQTRAYTLKSFTYAPSV